MNCTRRTWTMQDYTGRLNGLYRTVLYCTELYWAVLNCTRLSWAALDCTGIIWVKLWWTVLHQTVLGCVGMNRTILCWTKPYWAVLDSTELYWTVVGCSEMYLTYKTQWAGQKLKSKHPLRGKKNVITLTRGEMYWKLRPPSFVSVILQFAE